jgi:hypothetical protein
VRLETLETARQRLYTTLAASFSSKGVNIASGEEETGRSGHGTKEEKLSGLALAAPVLAALVLTTLALGGSGTGCSSGVGDGCSGADWSVCVE